MAGVFGPAFSVLKEIREETVFDSRFIVPVQEKCVEATHLYILLEGSFHWLDGATFEAPCAFMAAAPFFEGEHGARKASYRASGATFRAVEVRVSRDAFGDRGQLGPEPVLLSEGVMHCAKEFLDAAFDDDQATCALDLLTHLRADRVLQHDLAPRSFLEDAIESDLWGALEPVLKEMSLSTTGAKIAAAYGATSRRLHAALSRAVPSLFIEFTNWRAFSRRYRLKLAILFLSNPNVSVREVAKAVGYASTEALAHAFYAEDLPAPGVIRESILSYPERRDRITLPVPKA